MFPIIGNVPFKLLFPEGFVAFGGRGVFTAFVPVPETAVDENHGAVFRQDDIRFTRQGADVFADAVAGAVEHGADEDFGFGVFAAYPRHIP